MFIIKNNYYLYIENTESIDLNYIKKNEKISIIYRNNRKAEDLVNLNKFRRECKIKRFKFYIANNLKLAINCKADGLYVSAYNKKNYPANRLTLIGSAHNFKEIHQKIKQRCSSVILSRLFKTSYKNKNGYLGIVKFNLIEKNYDINILPLGGINKANLLKLNMVTSNGLCLLSEIKKKPTISNRLF